MADTLRELVVSLSLQSDNFSKNIKTVQNQIKEAESRFEAAGAGVDNFANKTDGLKAKAGLLSDKLRMQNQIVGQYERALNQANATLQRNAQTQQQNTAKLATAKKAQTDLSEAVKRGEATYKKYAAQFGETNARTLTAKNALDALKKKHTEASEEVKKLEGQLKANDNAMRRNADEITRIETALNKAKAAEAETKAELEKTNAALKTHKAQWEAAAASLDKFGKRASTAGQNMSKVGQALSMAVTTPLVALGGYALKASIDAESAFADVRKTVDMTEEQFAQLDQQIKDMTVYKPSDQSGYNQITDIAAAAGQFDIANEYVKDFTSTIVDLGVATDLVGREGATQLAQYAAVTNMAQSNFGRFGSTLVELGNTTKTTESAIMAMSTKIGSAGSIVGLTDAQILGFSAGLSSVGLEAEAGGSAFSKAIIGMQLAVETGKNGLKDYAKVSGMTAKEFQQAWKTDAAGAIQAFIVGLSKMDESGVSTIKTLNDMGFTEVRLRDTLMRASNASGLFSKALSSASSAWDENIALSEEAAKRYSTDGNRLIGLRQKASLLATTYGDDLNPALDDLIDTADDWLDTLGKMDAGQRQTMLTTAAWLAAIGPGIMLIGKMNTAVGSVATAIGGPNGLIQTSIAAGGGLKGVLSATGSLLGPAGIAVLAGAAIYGAAQWYDYASGAKAAREATAGMLKTAQEWGSSQAKTIFDTGNDPFARFKLNSSDFAGAEDGNKQLTKLEKQYAKLLKTMNSGKGGKKTKRNFDKNVEETIELRFELAEGDGGFEKLLTGVQAEKDRLAALGMEPTASTYADALSAAAKGNTEQVDALNSAYSDQYAEIMKIEDGTERKNALDKLNAEYQERMADAAERYAVALAKLTPGAFETKEVKEGAEQFKTLNDLIDKYTKAGSEGEKNTVLQEMTDLTKDMDEATLTSFLATMKQVDTQAQTLKGLNIDPTTIIPQDQLTTATTGIQNFTDAVTFLNGLTGPDADKLSGLKEMLSGSVTDELGRLSESLNLTPTVSIAQENVVTPTDLTLNALAKFTGYLPPDAVPTLESLAAFVGYSLPDSQPIIDSLAAFVGYTPPAGTKPTLDSIAAFVGYNPPTGESVTLDALAKFVNYSAPETQPTLDAMAAFVGYKPPEGTAVTLEALANFVKYSPPATQPALDALAAFVKYTPPAGEKPTLDSIAKFVKYTPPTSMPEIDVTANVTGVTYNPKTFELSSSNLEKDPGILGIGTSDIEQIQKVIALYQALKDAQFSGEASVVTSDDVLSRLETFLATADTEALKTFVEQYKALVDSGGTPSEDKTAQMQAIANLLQVIGGIGTGGEGVTSLVDALNGIFNADWSTDLDPAVEALQGLVDKAETVGADTGAGVGAGMAGYDFTTDANTVATNLDGALRGATGSHSPATKFVPVGVDIAAGVAKGIEDGTYKVENAMVAMAKAALKAAKDAMVIESPSHVMRDEVGVMIPRGVVVGIEEETARQQEAVQNAYKSLLVPSAAQQRVLSNAYDALVRQPLENARAGSIVNNTKNVTVNGGGFSLAGAIINVRDQQDIRALAIELGAYQSSQIRALGGST